MLINKGSEQKRLKNNILALSAQAATAKSRDPMVINATSGMLKNEDGSQFAFACVKKVMEGLSDEEKFAYANSFGTPSFAQAVLLSIFGDHLSPMLQQCCLDAIATPGGSGALSLAFAHYANPGETILLPNHMWENYLNLTAERGLKSSVYRLFDEAGHFDFDGLKKKAEFILKHQKRVLILLNDPCENPTGFCMEDSDYDALLDMARNDPEHDYVFAMDIAYFDFYDEDGSIIQKRFAKMGNLPDNAIALFAYSGSKSFGLYGLRIGGLAALSKDPHEIEVFHHAMDYSCRATWSSSSKLGIRIIEKLVLDDAARAIYEEERKSVYQMLFKRSQAFLEAAKAVGLKTLPYTRGFFLCVPCLDPQATMETLHEDGVYLIPTAHCLRIALCAINLEEAKRLPAILKARLP